MAPPVKKAGATAANTPTTIYLDTFLKNPVCDQDQKQVAKHCKPEPPQSDEDKKKGVKKPKKKGISGKLAEAAELLDDAGKLATGYRREKGSMSAFDGNGWMDDHCTGMWFAPTDLQSPELEKNLNSMLDKIENNKFGLLKDGFSQIKDLALEKAPGLAEEIATNFAIKTGVKVGLGAVLGETIVVPIAMGAWTAADIIQTAGKLAELAGDKGKAAYEALKSINNIGDKAKDIVENYKKEPHRAHADAMSLMAQLDPCLRARKCLLVPYENTAADGSKDEEESLKLGKPVATNKAKSQTKHGNGCCPGQTGHHILPDSMVDGAGCPGYDYKKAPTICLEGTKNGFKHGSHGMAHGNLSGSISEYKQVSGKNTLSYDEAKRQGILAVRKAGAVQCDSKCLEAQLDAHYKGCIGKELKADSGTSGKKTETQKPQTEDNG